jgi:hypothetical protein
MVTSADTTDQNPITAGHDSPNSAINYLCHSWVNNMI